MEVKNLLRKVGKLLRDKRLLMSSKVTFHVCLGGYAIEWVESGVMVECHGPNGDGLEINVDASGTGLLYKDEYTTVSPNPYKKGEDDRWHGWNEGYEACLKDLGYVVH